MAERIVLVSDDADFFEYILPKIRFRNSDELFCFNFDELPEKLDKLTNALFIINSENSEQKTQQLVSIINENPVIVFGYNEDENIKTGLYEAGMNSYVTPATSDTELNGIIFSNLKIVSSLEKNERYREILVDNKIITKNNEVYLDANSMLDRELAKIRKSASNAVLAAIAPDEKSKKVLQSNQIETLILNNIRKNDLLMTFAPNKYFLLLYNTDINTVDKLWAKIRDSIPEKVHAGFVQVDTKPRQQLVSEVLGKLHQSINNIPISNDSDSAANFKIYRQNFNKKMEQVIYPVFFHVQQTFNERLYGLKMEQINGEGYGTFILKSRYASGYFKITAPGLAKINIDIVYDSKYNDNKRFTLESKRITLEPHEFEAGLLQDLLERFIQEFKNEVDDEYIE